MTPTLKITGYVGGNYDDVIALVRRRGIETLRDAIDASEDRIARFERRTAASGEIEIDRFDATDSAVLTLRLEKARDLNGAAIMLSPVGDRTNLTEMVLTLAEPFGVDRVGSRQFLAASTFVAESTTRLTDELRNAA